MSHTNTFLALLVDAYTRARVEVEIVPPAGLGVELPGYGTTVIDYTEPIAQLADHPEERHPELAEQVVLAMMRNMRERGIPLGTHYPPRSDDHTRRALLAALSERGHDAHFTDPDTVALLGDAEKRTLHAHRYLAAAEGLDGDAVSRYAVEYVEGFERDYARGVQTSVSEDRLRVRVRPESSFPEEALPTLVSRPLTSDLRLVVVVDYPESMLVLRREQLGGMTEERALEAAVANSLEEPFEVSETDLLNTPIVHIGGGNQEYTLAHLNVLDRYLGEAPHGALVVLPSPSVVVAHVLGRSNPVTAMEHLQELAERYAADTNKPVSDKLYWWHPDSRGSDLPDLREVAITVDDEKREISLFTSDEEFRPLLESLMQSMRSES
ncbi:hypothetical protein GCM10007079_03160 [Nocardiopsis terrae]|uniref:Uncharacterized protein n=1 Tax=Nocardiopsis terrae TaxID=372655 RepID=A0ABR9HMY2_9ACTN|nr:hypothetical protein [Nocardiopsis terrae]MBE1460367.1 hypothetical protein [Nocardiopsis terrae]GHC71080.1 hypothetical protein GCM10007079_03160 [Nocardiopsis terrae]